MNINPLHQNTTNMTAFENKKLKGALQDFESLFIYYMLKECFKPNTGNHPGNHIYQDLIKEALSSQLAKSGGMGLAESLEKNLCSSPIDNKR